MNSFGAARDAGRAGDVIRIARGAARRTALQWQPELEFPVGGRVWQIHFDDWISWQDDAVMIDRATVSQVRRHARRGDGVLRNTGWGNS